MPLHQYVHVLVLWIAANRVEVPSALLDITMLS